MDRKFLIILFATVFYNGVTQSSPVGQQISDARLPEEKPPTVQLPTVDHINKKIETASVPTVKPSVPVSHDATPAPPHVEVLTDKNPTNNSTSELPHVVDGKNTTHAEINKNTHVVDNKTMNATADVKNVTLPSDKKNSTQAADSKNSTIPETGINSTVTPTPIPAGQTTTVTSTSVTTPASTTKASNTSSNTTVKPPTTVTTLAPSSTSKDSVIAGQNTPAPPAQEKHFDGASFVGGIVLTIGLTAIGFIAFKYYKSGKIDMNYRTL